MNHDDNEQAHADKTHTYSEKQKSPMPHGDCFKPKN